MSRHITEFQVSDIPNAMDNIKWFVSSALMKHWFKNTYQQWTEKYKNDLNLGDALKLKPSEYNDKIVTMKWAMQFEQVASNIEDIIASVNNTNGTNAQLIKRLKRKGWKKGTADLKLLKVSDVRTFEDGNQVQIIKIGGNILSDRIDDYYGALARATLKLGLVGQTTIDDKFVVKEVGIYIKDSYEFLEKGQPLGYWTYNHIFSKARVASSALSKKNNRWVYTTSGDEAVKITNDDFVKYQNMHKKGGDFLVFSNIHWVIPKEKIILDLKLAIEEYNKK